MATLDRPRLRPLSARRIDHRGQPFVVLDDPMGLAHESVSIPLHSYWEIVRRFDGRSSLDEIESRFYFETGCRLAPGDLRDFVGRLDRALILDGPTFDSVRRSYASQESRPPALAGRSYPGRPEALRDELARIFAHPDASGPPRKGVGSTSDKLRGIICPHIDLGRGGPVYTWAYRELLERSDAETLVILGVAHQPCRRRFALTLKDFETPLGRVETDRAYVERIAREAPADFFEDELAHRTEHSIEFQAVLLRYLMEAGSGRKIVPILVGSFHDLMVKGTVPMEDPEVRGMVEALRSAEAASDRKVAYIAAIDLCHIGPEFGDPDPVGDETLARIRDFDRSMLHHATRPDPRGWFEEAAQVDNRWRVCGLAATYTMLQVMGSARGRLLRYDQAVNHSRTCCVTFASASYDAEP